MKRENGEVIPKTNSITMPVTVNDEVAQYTTGKTGKVSEVIYS